MTTMTFILDDFLLPDDEVLNLRVECDYSPGFKYGHERGGPFTPDDEEDLSVAKVFNNDTDVRIHPNKEVEKMILAECWKELERTRQP